MKKQALLACLSFLVCCSRSGENPLPIEPLQPRSEYDIEASELRITTQSGGPHSPTIKVGADVWIATKVCNVGLQPVSGVSIGESLGVNGRRVASHTGPRSSRLVPGGCSRGVISHPGQAAYPGVWYFKPEEPGRYEFKYRVSLSSLFEEENKDNNELVVAVEVKE